MMIFIRDPPSLLQVMKSSVEIVFISAPEISIDSLVYIVFVIKFITVILSLNLKTNMFLKIVLLKKII